MTRDEAIIRAARDGYIAMSKRLEERRPSWDQLPAYIRAAHIHEAHAVIVSFECYLAGH